jgi:DnaJ-class molecular chaperone
MKRRICFVLLGFVLTLAFIGCSSFGSSSSPSGSFTSNGTCLTCLGKGYVEEQVSENIDNGLKYIKKTCSTCFGRGRI